MPPRNPSSQAKPRLARARPAATFREERTLRTQGYELIAGVDEVGRGAWAGPVVAAAVILGEPSPGLVRKLRGVADSKLLTPQQRETLDVTIRRHAAAIGIGSVAHHVIDEINILNATKVAMAMAVAALPLPAEYLLIDAVRLTDVSLPQKPIIHGDALCLSIAAASIVAKVHRDRLMAGYGLSFPEYRFASNKGYGTMAHFRALRNHGLLHLHRRSFIPMRYMVRRDEASLATYRKMVRLLDEEMATLSDALDSDVELG